MVGTLEKIENSVEFNLGDVEKIPLGEGREYEVEGRLVAVFRDRGGAIFATQAHCPHRMGHLADGLIGGGRVICPMHSYKFDLSTGEAIGADCPALIVYSIRINENGEMMLAES
jgi:nitrite reductase (NADH) small subunit